jgi:hypothetical protein
LALFGRRPPQRVEGFVMPASKNQNITNITRRLPLDWSDEQSED